MRLRPHEVDVVSAQRVAFNLLLEHCPHNGPALQLALNFWNAKLRLRPALQEHGGADPAKTTNPTVLHTACLQSIAYSHVNYGFRAIYFSMLAFFAARRNESSIVIETHQQTNLHKLQKRNSFVRAPNKQGNTIFVEFICLNLTNIRQYSSWR